MPYGLFEGLSIIAGPIKQELVAASFQNSLSSSGPWRPSEWTLPALTSIRVPVQLPATASGGVDAFGNPLAGAGTQIYVFDAVLKAEHSRELRRTEHPIQTSSTNPVASITDHAYLLPARVTLEIGMSDAMDSYSAGMWTGNASKSVSAHQTLVSLQKQRTLFTLTTRLETYKNMIVESIRPSETARSRRGYRATVVFSETFLADATGVSSSITFPTDDTTGQAASARPQTTDSTPSGTVQPGTPSPSLLTQHTVPATTTVPGAGSFSSSNISALPAY